jgi:membrane protein YqaA with SNARE-associated domain
MRLNERLASYASDAKAEVVLFWSSLAESSVLPLRPDNLLVPMCTVNQDHSFRYAFVASVGSVIGGAIGYVLGLLLLTTVISGVVSFYGLQSYLELFHRWFSAYDVYIITAAGISPVPFFLVSILSGVSGTAVASFITAAALSRSTRYFFMAWLIWRGGTPKKQWVESNFYPMTMAASIVLILCVVMLKLLFGG